MANCLVTTLKAIVDNENLPLFDKVVINVKAIETPSSTTQRLIVRQNYGTEEFDCEIIGDGEFMRGNYPGTPIGKTTKLNASNPFVYCSNGNYTITIKNSYNIQSLDYVLLFGDLSKYEFSDIIYAKPTSSLLNSYPQGNVASTKNWKNLTIFELPSQGIEGDLDVFGDKIHLEKLNVFDSKVEGDITSLKNLTNLTELKLRHFTDKTKIYGDITTAFGNMTSLTTLNVFQNTHVRGSIESMVAAWVNNGKASGSVSSRTYSTSTSFVTFNGNALPSSGTQTIVWAPNTTAGRTDITVNEVTVTIDN